MIISVENIQKESFKILEEFHKICEHENLRYILDYGTLLGAVRHEGFIPWDDDLDVAMPREDYEKFLKVATNYLPENIVVQNNRTEKNYFMPFTKLRKTDVNIQEDELGMYRVSKGVWIDIFVYDYTSQDEGVEKLKIKQLNKLRNYYNYTFPVIYEKDKQIKNWPKTFVKIVMLRMLEIAQNRENSYLLKFIRSRYLKLHEEIISQPSNPSLSTLRCYQTKDLSVNQTDNILYIESFENRILLPFEGKKFYCPENFDTVLKYRYNDYMTLPTIDERKSTHKWIIPRY